MQRLAVGLRHPDHVGAHPLAAEMLARARRVGVAGATVLEQGPAEGAAPPGADRLFPRDVPVCLLVVDRPERITALRQALGDLLADRPVRTHDVTAFRA